MLGSLLDRIFVAFSNRHGKLDKKVKHLSFKKNEEINWVCFIPEFCNRVPYLREKIMLKNINVDFYITPKTIIQPDPKKTKKYLDDVLKLAIKNQKKKYPGKPVNILGISLGNVLAFRFAQHFKVEKLVSVVPGSNLTDCIIESIATKSIIKNSKSTLEDYKKQLKNYNPIEYISSIEAISSYVYLGGADLMIPTKRGKELAQAMQKRLKTKLFLYNFSGHVETLLRFSRKFKNIVRLKDYEK